MNKTLLIFCALPVAVAVAMVGTSLWSGSDDGPVAARCGPYEFVVVKRRRIYYPRPFDVKRSYERIGLVDTRLVLNATPERKEIRERGLEKGSAHYQILMKRASDRFKKAVMRAVRLGGYDLIADRIALRFKGRTPPDISSYLIGLLGAETPEAEAPVSARER